MDEDFDDFECECRSCPNCGGFEVNACEHGDLCTCTDEDKAEARLRADTEEDQDGSSD